MIKYYIAYCTKKNGETAIMLEDSKDDAIHTQNMMKFTHNVKRVGYSPWPMTVSRAHDLLGDFHIINGQKMHDDLAKELDSLPYGMVA